MAQIRGMGQKPGAMDHVMGVTGGAATGAGLGALGGPVGAGIGAAVGGTLGLVQGLTQRQPLQGIPGPSGVDRRMAQLQQDPMIGLQMAQAALPKLPPQVQERLRPTFSQAMAVAGRSTPGGYS